MKLKSIIENDVGKIPTKKILKKLKTVSKAYDETLMVQNSSQKMLSFLVNDILDFAQLRSGKFRKDISFFNIKEAI